MPPSVTRSSVQTTVRGFFRRNRGPDHERRWTVTRFERYCNKPPVNKAPVDPSLLKGEYVRILKLIIDGHFVLNDKKESPAFYRRKAEDALVS